MATIAEDATVSLDQFQMLVGPALEAIHEESWLPRASSAFLKLGSRYSRQTTQLLFSAVLRASKENDPKLAVSAISELEALAEETEYHRRSGSRGTEDPTDQTMEVFRQSGAFFHVPPGVL